MKLKDIHWEKGIYLGRFFWGAYGEFDSHTKPCNIYQSTRFPGLYECGPFYFKQLDDAKRYSVDRWERTQAVLTTNKNFSYRQDSHVYA